MIGIEVSVLLKQVARLLVQRPHLQSPGDAARIRANARSGHLRARKYCNFSVIASGKCKVVPCMYAERVACP